MSAPGSTHRTGERAVMLAFRCSPADRDELRERARSAGISMQTYLERLIFDRPEARDRASGRPARRQEELPMTG